MAPRFEGPTVTSHVPDQRKGGATNAAARRGRGARTGIGLALLLLAGGWVASEIEVPRDAAATDLELGWRRTAEGWEWTGTWESPPPPFEPALHPAVVCSLQVLLSTLALVALPSRWSRSHPRGQRQGPSKRRHVQKKSHRRATAPIEPQLR